MAVTEARQTSDPFELDEYGDVSYPSERGEEDVLRGLGVFDEAGTLGLHVGLLRRFAMLAPAAPPRSTRPAVDR